jgi:uncharacterized protein (UPF0548 family)
MFFATRPSPARIAAFLRDSQTLPLSYGPVRLLDAPGSRHIDQAEVQVGHGPDDFARACAALSRWQQFNVGWVETYAREAPSTVGTVVAVLIRHLGFWSLNGCRVVYEVGARDTGTRFGYAYGTLPNHAEAGEELFEVSMDPRTLAVTYRIRATSWPNAALAYLGQPIVRHLQARFRRDSLAAMVRAVR